MAKTAHKQHNSLIAPAIIAGYVKNTNQNDASELVICNDLPLKKYPSTSYTYDASYKDKYYP